MRKRRNSKAIDELKQVKDSENIEDIRTKIGKLSKVAQDLQQEYIKKQLKQIGRTTR